MRRTRFLLLCLLIIAFGLGAVKLIYTPQPPQAESNIITTAPLPSPTLVVPTVSSRLSYVHPSHPFTFQYPPGWTIQSVPPDAKTLDAFSLLAPIASPGAVPAQFDFSLVLASLSASLPAISCPSQLNTCQIQSINGVDYKLSATDLSDKSVTVQYQAVSQPYLLNITAELNQNQTQNILTSWQTITQSFIFNSDSVTSE